MHIVLSLHKWQEGSLFNSGPMISVLITLCPVVITTLSMSKTVPKTFSWHLMWRRRSLALSLSSQGKSWQQVKSRTRPAWPTTSPSSTSSSGERLYLPQVDHQRFHYNPVMITGCVWNGKLVYYFMQNQVHYCLKGGSLRFL